MVFQNNSFLLSETSTYQYQSLSSETVIVEPVQEKHELVVTFQVEAESSAGGQFGQMDTQDALIQIQYNLPHHLVEHNFSLSINESVFDFRHDGHNIRFGLPETACASGYMVTGEYPLFCGEYQSTASQSQSMSDFKKISKNILFSILF